MYQISNHGNVRGIERKRTANENGGTITLQSKLLKPYKGGKNNGYLRVSLSSNNKKKIAVVHRMVAEYFIPNPDNKPMVNHKDLNRYNNHYLNLEWCTNSENMLHYYANRQ